MKKKNYSFSNARYWNKLVHKFYNLNNKIKKLLLSKTTSKTQVNILLDRLKKLYRKLTQLQVKVGIKVAGTALALLLATSTLNAQDFAFQGNLTLSGESGIYAGMYASLVFEDIDGDGDLDLFVGNGNGIIKTFINDGSGVFARGDNLKADGADIDVVNTVIPTFADIDGDDDLDLYVGTYHGNIIIYINDGSGVFSVADSLRADGSIIDVGYRSVPIFADIDGDADLDLLVGERYGTIKTFINDGSGGFTAGANFQADGGDIDVGGYSSPVFADIDGDGDLDLYVGERFGEILTFINDGSFGFTAGANLQADGSDIAAGAYIHPVFEDIDDDGDLDLFVANQDGIIKTYTNSSGVFSASANFQATGLDINVGDYGFSTPVFADIDGDGDLDLFVGEKYGSIRTFVNDGSGISTAGANLQADGVDIDGHGANFVFADVDGDSDLDLFVGNMYGEIFSFINDGSGVFSAGANLQADGSDINIYSAKPVFADVDGDSDLDLFVGNLYGEIFTFINDGSGVFSAGANFQADGSDIDVGRNASPVFADLDGDSDLDLYVGNDYGEILSFINDGSGVFSAGDTLQADGSKIDVGYAAKPVFADIDGDGDLDLYVGNYNGNIVFYKDITPVIKINELLNFEISVFPNPTTGIVNLSFNEQNETYNISIVDISGKTVESFVNINNNNFQIDMSKHDKGLYILKVYNDKAVKTSKIIVE